MTPKQAEIIRFANENEGLITSKQAINFSTAYHNKGYYTSLMLSRMVTAGMLIRVKKGVFKISPGQKIIKNQHQLSS